MAGAELSIILMDALAETELKKHSQTSKLDKYGVKYKILFLLTCETAVLAS